MSAALHHLVSRGVDIAKSHQQTFVFQLPTWGLVMLGLTTVFFFMVAGAVSIVANVPRKAGGLWLTTFRSATLLVRW